jgi:SpoVK/Ycf46/Vps4 family AAA+-type ATPase
MEQDVRQAVEREVRISGRKVVLQSILFPSLERLKGTLRATKLAMLLMLVVPWLLFWPFRLLFAGYAWQFDAKSWWLEKVPVFHWALLPTLYEALGALVVVVLCLVAWHLFQPFHVLRRRAMLKNFCFALHLEAGKFLTWDGRPGGAFTLRKLGIERQYVTSDTLLYVLFLSPSGDAVSEVVTWDGSGAWAAVDTPLTLVPECPARALLVEEPDQPRVFATRLARALAKRFDRIGQVLEGVRQEFLKHQREQREQRVDDYISGDPVRAEVIERVRDFLHERGGQARGLILHGPPGTGKTYLVEKLRTLLKVRVEFVAGGDLKGPYIGQSEQRVKELWSKLREKQPCVLFVDECEGVFGRRRGQHSDSFEDAVARTFLSEWDGKDRTQRIYVIGSTNHASDLDPAILSRCDAVLELTLPDPKARSNHIRAALRNEISEAGLEELVKLSMGYSYRDLNKMMESVQRWTKRGVTVAEAVALVVSKTQRSGSTKVDSSVTLESMVLAPELEREIKALCGMIKNAEVFKAKGVTVPRAALLYGPPGTGKTMLAKAIANETGLSFVAPTTTEVKGRYLGSAAALVATHFKEARDRAPSILCLDELDLLAPSRGSNQADALTKECVGQLLQEMEGIAAHEGQVFVLGITNHLERIDEAIVSRFRKRIRVGPPARESLRAAIERFFSARPCGFEPVTVAEELSGRLEGCSMRQVVGLLEEAETTAVARAVDGGEVEQFRIELSDIPVPQQTVVH